MYWYLALVFCLLTVNCDENEERAKAVNAIINNPKLMTPLETNPLKLLAMFGEIPQPVYEKSFEFFNKIQPQLQSLPAENLARKHIEDLAVLNAFYKNTVCRPVAAIMKMLGSICEFARNAAEVRRASTASAKPELADSFVKSLQEFDSNLLAELKAYIDNSLEQLKDADVKPEHMLVKYLSQAKVLLKIFEVTGGNEPSEELLKANPWIEPASTTAVPNFSQYIAWKTASANLVRSIS